MIVPFLIMLREGIEAALIVGIVASYLVRSGRREWLPALWIGVGLACAVSLAASAALDIVVGELPQRGQELFEAVIGLIAAAMLTSMVFWMRKAARSIKGELQAGVDAALSGAHQGLALVGLAFLAVVREGLESVFFLLAIFQQNSGWAPAIGAGLGIGLAAVIGYAIYALGVKLNLRSFFRWTGILILFVAAGLVANAVRSLHEAGLWNHLQQGVYDLGTVLPADSALGAVLSGFFGYQERAALGEVLAYLAFLIPMLALFLLGGRETQTSPAPQARVQRSPRLKLAGMTALLLACGGVTAFIYAAGSGGRRGAAAGTSDIAIAITDRTCQPATLTVPAGRLSFVVSNRGERVLEWEILDGVMVLEERENIAPGQSRRLTTQLHPGEYAITCGLLSAPRGRLIVQASTAQPRPALTLMDIVGPAAEYRAVLSERSAALGAALDRLEQAEGTGDLQAAGKARREAAALLSGLHPATADDGELEGLYGTLQAALSGAAVAIKPAAETFRAALAQRTVLPDTMLAGAINLLSSPDGEAASPEDAIAASDIAKLLLPLTVRVDPALAARVRADLVALPDDAKPGGARQALAEDLAAMRKALALPEAERKS